MPFPRISALNEMQIFSYWFWTRIACSIIPDDSCYIKRGSYVSKSTFVLVSMFILRGCAFLCLFLQQIHFFFLMGKQLTPWYTFPNTFVFAFIECLFCPSGISVNKNRNRLLWCRFVVFKKHREMWTHSQLVNLLLSTIFLFFQQFFSFYLQDTSSIAVWRWMCRFL